MTEIALQNEEQNNQEIKLKKNQLRLEGVRFEKESQLSSQEKKKDHKEFNILMLNHMQAERQVSQQQNNQLMILLTGLVKKLHQNNNN